MLILLVSLKLFSINNSVQDDVKVRFSLGSRLEHYISRIVQKSKAESMLRGIFR